MIDLLDVLIILLFLWCLWWNTWRISMPTEVTRDQVIGDKHREFLFCLFLPITSFVLALCFRHLWVRF